MHSTSGSIVKNRNLQEVYFTSSQFSISDNVQIEVDVIIILSISHRVTSES